MQDITLLTLYKVIRTDGNLIDCNSGYEKYDSVEEAKVGSKKYPFGKVLGNGWTENGTDVQIVVIDTKIIDAPVNVDTRKTRLLEFFSEKQLKRIDKNLALQRAIFDTGKGA